MATGNPNSYSQRLRSWCHANSIEQPKWQDYSDPRGIRTAWSSSVVVQGREFRAELWRDYRYLERCREEAAEAAYKALIGYQSPTSYSKGWRSP